MQLTSQSGNGTRERGVSISVGHTDISNRPVQDPSTNSNCRYSIYVLESSTSRRLTYFMPPLNLIPLIFLRPLRLILPSDEVRRIRILALKATHVPFVALIWAYERCWREVSRRSQPTLTKAPHLTNRPLSSGQFSLDGDRDGGRSTGHRPAANRVSSLVNNTATEPNTSATDNADLMGLIQKLSAQVDTLTAMVAGQQSD